MEKQYLLGLGAFGLLVAASFALSRPTAVDPAPEASAAASARLTLAAVSADARRDIDYAALDARLKRLIQERAMVGMAVGIVEDGRITFLSGYGETLAGSGDRVNARASRDQGSNSWPSGWFRRP